MIKKLYIGFRAALGAWRHSFAQTRQPDVPARPTSRAAQKQHELLLLLAEHEPSRLTTESANSFQVRRDELQLLIDEETHRSNMKAAEVRTTRYCRITDFLLLVSKVMAAEMLIIFPLYCMGLVKLPDGGFVSVLVPAFVQLLTLVYALAKKPL